MSSIPATGIEIPTQEEELESIQSEFKGEIASDILLDAEEPFGQITGISSERSAKGMEAVQGIYNALMVPGGSSGIPQDHFVGLLGIERLPATKSTIAGVALFGSVATSIPAGTEFSVPDTTGKVFVTDTTVVLIAGTDEVQTISFSGTPTSGEFKLTFEGEITTAIQWDDAAIDIQNALNALDALSGVTVSGSFAADFVVTFAGVDGKQPQVAIGFTDNNLDDGGAVTISIVETTPGVNQGTVNCTAKETGAISVNIETLTQIDTPIAGLDSIFNPVAAVTGREREGTADLWARREKELVTSKAGTGDAIRAALLAINDTVTGAVFVENVSIFINATKLVDGAGRPPSSFEVVVYQTNGGTELDDEIASAIFEAHPYGIESHGDISNIVVDDEGIDQTVKFSRPSEILIYCDVALTVDSDIYPSDGDDQVEADIIVFGNALDAGQDVIVYPELIIAIGQTPGILDIVVDIGIAPSPSGDDNIEIDPGDISVWQAANINVTS